MCMSCQKTGHLDKTTLSKDGHLCGTLHTNKQTNTCNRYTHIHLLPTDGSTSQCTHQGRWKSLLHASHWQTHTHTFKRTTEAHVCMSCQKMGHLDKTNTTKRWDIFVLRCTQTNKHTQQIHTRSSPAYRWVNFTTHTPRKMKIFALWSTLTNTHTHTFKRTKEAHVCMYMSCQKMGHLNKTNITKRWDIFVVRCTQTNKHTTNTHMVVSCLQMGQLHNTQTKKDENLCCMLHTDKHTHI